MFRRLIDINLTGSFLVAQACGRHMIRAGTGGSIVLIASMSGSIVNYPQEQCSYNASKAAVIQLGRSLAAEWARHNIRVNSLSPGYMNTDLNRAPALETQKKIWTSMTPQQRLGDADELNGVAVWLASDASSFTTGANVVVDVSLENSHLRHSLSGDEVKLMPLFLIGRLLGSLAVSWTVAACVERDVTSCDFCDDNVSWWGRPSARHELDAVPFVDRSCCEGMR